MSVVHTFDASLAWGEAASDEPFWEAVYRKGFPDLVSISRNADGNTAQYLGIDRWLHLRSGKTLTVDEKKRSRDWPDILLEYVSNSTTGAPGWIEKDLQIDYLAYAFLPSHRCYLFPWQMLRRAWLHFRAEWLELALSRECGFRQVIADNPGYQTFSVSVPTDTLRNAVHRAMLIDVSRDLTSERAA